MKVYTQPVYNAIRKHFHTLWQDIEFTLPIWAPFPYFFIIKHGLNHPEMQRIFFHPLVI